MVQMKTNGAQHTELGLFMTLLKISINNADMRDILHNGKL